MSCWKNHTVTATQISEAVTKGYLTQEEANSILFTPN
jgi:hypothetical protein